MTFGPMIRALWLLIVGSALVLPLTANAQSRSEQGVYERLAQVGITPDQVATTLLTTFGSWCRR